jgi:hypothetical protein
MSLIEIRKIVTLLEEERHEGGPPSAAPLVKGAALAVMKNPYAGGYAEDITPMMEALKPTGLEMAERLVAAMGVGVEGIEAYGKGSIVGGDGELEHGALWHVPGGYAMRELLGGAKAIVPSAKRSAASGPAWTSRCITSTPPMCAVISAPWK